jgi:hypothetical protein
MIKLVWFITRPETNIAEAESMYQVIALSESYSDSFLPIAAELQQVFFTTIGDQPLSPGWLNVYGERT